MSSYAFNQRERHAVYTVHRQRCYVCGAALTMKTMQIDHVVPESVAGDATTLSEVCADLGLPADFDVNGYENWLPACAECNGKKREMVWRPSLLAQLALQRAAERAPKAREVAARLVSDQKVASALAVLEAANGEGDLTDEAKEQLRPLLEAYVQDRAEENAGDPVRVTPSYTVPLYEILGDDGQSVTVRGPYGVGGGPSGTASAAMRCSSCGLPYFSGARCVICGMMDDD